MGRFYLKIYRDGKYLRTWGCGSRSQNHLNAEELIRGIIDHGNDIGQRPRIIDRLQHSIANGLSFSKSHDCVYESYRIEFKKKSRCGEKELYLVLKFDVTFNFYTCNHICDNARIFSNVELYYKQPHYWNSGIKCEDKNSIFSYVRNILKIPMLQRKLPFSSDKHVSVEHLVELIHF